MSCRQDAGVLESLVIDVTHDHNTRDTARRVAKMYLNEVFRGRYVGQPPVTEFPNAEYLNELMIVGPLTVRSACSHHLCPIWKAVDRASAQRAFEPHRLSKYSPTGGVDPCRPADPGRGERPVADLLMAKVAPDGLAVVMEADHFCMHWRGVEGQCHQDGEQRHARRFSSRMPRYP